MKGKIRCSWCKDDNLLKDYHHNEWGKPILDDQKLFEILMLEIFQAGLSWKIILRKRKKFIEAFDNFNFKKIANYDNKKVKNLMRNRGIVRNKLKISATISNAICVLKIQKKEGKFYNYIKSLIQKKNQNKLAKRSFFVSKSIIKVLKNDGFTFIGPKILDSFLMSSGFINGHEKQCYRYSEI